METSAYIDFEKGIEEEEEEEGCFIEMDNPCIAIGRGDSAEHLIYLCALFCPHVSSSSRLEWRNNPVGRIRCAAHSQEVR